MEQIELYERLIKAYDRIGELEEMVDFLKFRLRNVESESEARAACDSARLAESAEALKKENSALRAEIESLKKSKGLPFLRSLLMSKGIKQKDAANLCGVSDSTISRACKGYIIESPSVAKIVSGLGLNDEEAKEMYKQTRRKK